MADNRKYYYLKLKPYISYIPTERTKILPLGNLSKCTWKCTWLSRINAPGYAPNEQSYPQWEPTAGLSAFHPE